MPRAFDDAIETEVESLAAPEVMLASGVRVSVHPTPALVAIDVDAGGALAGRDGGARGGISTLNMAVIARNCPADPAAQFVGSDFG